MEYKYERESRNFEDLASGRVLLNARGTTAFPVRLASEIYLRARSYLQFRTPKARYTVYDPCCGGAYLLTTIGLLHGRDLKHLIGSDIDTQILDLAQNNLAMVNLEGIHVRIEQLREMYKRYGKDSHQEAITSAERLRNLIEQRKEPIRTTCFQADAGYPFSIKEEVDLVFTDVPYGNLVSWAGEDQTNPVERLLGHVRPVLAPVAVVAVIADKKQSIKHPDYNRLERFKVGKRQVVLLEPK